MANALATIPPALKKIMPYMKRAEELDKDTLHPESKAVAYYCRAYAMDQAMLLRDQSNQKEVMPYLLALMDKLEVDKKGMPPVAEGKALVKAFADRVFTKADEEDQIGAADKNTARTFYAAGVFYDVMQQFRAVPGEGGEAEQEAERELERRRKYCKWKAADILNAIKEGRTPTAGGYGDSAMPEGEGEGEGPPATAEGKPPASASASASAGASSPPPPAYTAATTAPAAKPTSPPPYQAPAPAPAPKPTAPAPVPAASKPVAASVGGPKQAALDDAKELCYFAIAAIQHKETALAVERLEKALQRLKSIS